MCCCVSPVGLHMHLLSALLSFLAIWASVVRLTLRGRHSLLAMAIGRCPGLSGPHGRFACYASVYKISCCNAWPPCLLSERTDTSLRSPITHAGIDGRILFSLLAHAWSLGHGVCVADARLSSNRRALLAYSPDFCVPKSRLTLVRVLAPSVRWRLRDTCSTVEGSTCTTCSFSWPLRLPPTMSSCACIALCWRDCVARASLSSNRRALLALSLLPYWQA